MYVKRADGEVKLFLQYSMMAVVAGLLAPLLWDSLWHLAPGLGLCRTDRHQHDVAAMATLRHTYSAAR